MEILSTSALAVFERALLARLVRGEESFWLIKSRRLGRASVLAAVP